MEQTWMKKEGSRNLILFFAGWNASPGLLDFISRKDFDYLLCWNYRSLEADWDFLPIYDSVDLLAWSFGIRVAQAAMPAMKGVKWGKKTAVNGTLFPVHDRYGIDPDIFKKTVSGFSEDVWLRFMRNMVADREERRFVRERIGLGRTWADAKAELDFLAETVCAGNGQEYLFPETGFWDRAFVSRFDLIFPPSHQLAAWKKVCTETVLRESGHFDSALFASLLKGEEP